MKNVLFVKESHYGCHNPINGIAVAATSFRPCGPGKRAHHLWMPMFLEYLNWAVWLATNIHRFSEGIFCKWLKQN